MPAKKRLPYQPWYVDDFWGEPNVQMLRIEAVFAYIASLDLGWKCAGSLPKDEKDIFRLAAGLLHPELSVFLQTHWNSIEQFWPPSRNGRRYNARQVVEWKKAMKKLNQKVSAGKSSARKRLGVNGRSTDAPTDVERTFLPDPDPDNINLKRSKKGSPEGRKADSGFDEFWNIWPKKKAKGAARKAWLKLKPDAELQAKIGKAIMFWKESDDWIKEGRRFCPHPATWLNTEGWEDEPPEQARTDPYRPYHEEEVL